MNEYTVLYEIWQMQCCGQPFRIGDVVEWSVFVFGKGVVGTDKEIDYIYDAHYETDEGLYILRGTVCRIEALFTIYKPSADNPIVQVPDSGFLRNIEKADGREKVIDGAIGSDYLVVLKDADIQQSAKNFIREK